jgi:hypothetical protein
MSSATLTALTCDRCCATETREEAAGRGDWGWVAVNQYGGTQPIPAAQHAPADLCAGCRAQFQAWWLEPRAPVTPPAPAPAAPRPFTIEDRRRAIETLVDVVRWSITRAFGLVLQQPTSILSGEIVPGAFDGIEDSAATFVDDILHDTGVRKLRK